MELQPVAERIQPVKLVLDDAWTLSCQRKPPGEEAAVSTAAILFTLCDPARMRAFPGSVTMRYLHEVLEGRWIRLSTQRSLFLGHGWHCEARASQFGTLSNASRRVVRHARVLAHEADAPRLRMRHLFRALLVQPGKPEEISAHAVLREIGLDPMRLACNFLCG
jgi:hypothetical protein